MERIDDGRIGKYPQQKGQREGNCVACVSTAFEPGLERTDGCRANNQDKQEQCRRSVLGPDAQEGVVGVHGSKSHVVGDVTWSDTERVPQAQFPGLLRRQETVRVIYLELGSADKELEQVGS